MSCTESGGIEISKKIWAGVPGSDANGHSDPNDTIQYAFGVTLATQHFADIVAANGYVDPASLIGGVITITGAKPVRLVLPPGQYRLYEFVINRDSDGHTLMYSHRGGWDLSAVIDGVPTAARDEDDGAISFKVASASSVVKIVAINKSVCVEIDKRFSSNASAARKGGILFFGTSSYLGLTQDGFNWNGSAIVRLGLTNRDGRLRLDGFTSGNNVFIHEVVPKADYDAGVRPTEMAVYRLDGTLWYTAGFPDSHEVSRTELDKLLADPKFTAAGLELIRSNVHVGDWIFTNQNYFYERQGVMRVSVLNNNGKKGRLELSKKIAAGVPGADANGRSNPSDTIQYAFGVVLASQHYSDIATAEGFVDPSKLIGGVLTVTGANKLTLDLEPGQYKLFEFVIVRDVDSVSLLYKQRQGWDFTAEIDGVLTSPSDDADGAIRFDIDTKTAIVKIIAINKSLCVQIDKRFSGNTGAMRKDGILFFGTSSYLGLTQDGFNWNGGAIVRLGLTDGDGTIRLDGFVSGNNVFIHEVVPKAAYDAGVRPIEMTVYRLNGTILFKTGFPASHQVTQLELDMLLRDPKFTPAGRELIRTHLHVGDWLFAAQEYFNERQGVMRVSVLNGSAT